MSGSVDKLCISKFHNLMIEFQSLLESVDIPSYFVYSSHLKVKTTKLELHVYLNTTHVVFEAQNPSKVV